MEKAGKLAALSVLVAWLLATTVWAAPAGQTRFNLAPDSTTAWVADRPNGDDFLPPPSGPGPVTGDPAHAYIPNGAEGVQPTYRVADLDNPILMPWVVERMRKANEDVLAGKIPFVARERCWPSSIPGFLVDARIVPIYFLETPQKITMIIQNDARLRRIFLNVPHSKNLTPSWYGESVGHYEGNTLVVDTIGMNDKSFVDNYGTPHTEQLHVVERWEMRDNGNLLQIDITVEDRGAFTTPWKAMQRYKRVKREPMNEERCAENPANFLGEDVRPIPQAEKPDF